MARTLKRRSPFVIQAFMVSGVAPDSLFDMNGNGSIDPEDATLAGYTVLSNRARIRFGMVHAKPVGASAGRDLNAMEAPQ